MKHSLNICKHLYTSAAAHLTQVHQTAGKLHIIQVCQSDVWVGGKEMKKRNRMKANSQSQGCGSWLFVSIRRKKQDKHIRRGSSLYSASTDLMVCCVLWWLQRKKGGTTQHLLAALSDPHYTVQD